MGGKARRALVALASAALAACGLRVVGSAEDLPAGGSPGLDATSSRSTTAGDGDGVQPGDAASGGNADADADADAAFGSSDGGCTTVFDDGLTAPGAAWDLLGTAAAAANGVALTPQTSSAVAGAMWKKSSLSFSGSLHVVVDIAFETAGSDPVGDGMTVAWLQAPPAYTLGSAGLSMGLCAAGMKGTAVQLDDLNDRLVVLNAFSADCDTDGAILTAARVAMASQVVVDILPDRMTGTLDTGKTMTRAKTIPTTGFLGITAGTGGGNTRHVVRHVRISSCP